MKLKLEVGQPKNFDAGDKTNIIIGTVVEGLDGFRTLDFDPLVRALKEDKRNEKMIEYWFVVKSAAPVPFEGGTTFTSILLMPRYRTKKPPLELLKDGETLVCNGMWRQDGGDWDAASIQAAQEGKLDVEGVIVTNVRFLE